MLPVLGDKKFNLKNRLILSIQMIMIQLRK